MKKKVFGRKLSRNTNTRKALMRSVVRALVANGTITTTRAKAKAVQTGLEKLVTTSKDSSVAARRRLYAALGNDRTTADRLYNITQKTFLDTKGGYTRLINLPRRKGDFAEMMRLEWSTQPEAEKKSVESKKGSKSTTASVEKKGIKGKLLSKVAGKGKKPATLEKPKKSAKLKK